MTQSAVLMTSRLCSTTMTVLPRSTSRLQHVEQLANIVEVQAGGRLIEEIDSLAGAGPGQFRGQLDALGLAAGQRRRRLAQAPDSRGRRRRAFAARRRIFGMLPNSSSASLTRMFSTSAMRLPLIADGQRLRIVAAALADIASHPDIGKEVHLDFLLAVAFAGLTAAARLVEAESLGLIAAHFRFGQLGEELANQIEDAGIGRRVRVGRIADRVLIDVDDLVDLFQPENVIVGCDRVCGRGAACGPGCCTRLR